MKIAGFGVEAWLNAHEREATTDISQSSIAAVFNRASAVISAAWA